MLSPVRREVLGPGLHRFVFASQSRPGLTHEVLYDETDGMVSCLCDAALRGRGCKHQRYVRSLFGEEKDHPPAGA